MGMANEANNVWVGMGIYNVMTNVQGIDLHKFYRHYLKQKTRKLLDHWFGF